MKSKEKAVREAADALQSAIAAAKADGFVIDWPRSPEGLSAIAISETGKASVTVGVNTRDVDPALAAKAGEAAQAAADKVIEKGKA